MDMQATDENPIQAIAVTDFEMTGEGSGTFWHEVLRPALEKSTGYLEVARIWEGEYVDKLVVKNGVITERLSYESWSIRNRIHKPA